MAIDEGNFNGDYGNDWNVLMQRQQREQETAQDAGIERLGQQTMADFDDLVARDNAAQAEATNRRNATLGAMMICARQNKGFVPKAILGEASQRMGMPVAGGNYDENGNFVLYGVTQGADGQEQFSPLAVASPAQQLLVLQRAKMGPDMRREIYGVLRGRNSAETLAKYGIENPDAPSPTGPAVTMRDGTAQRLGASILGPEKRGGSMFYTNGRGYTLRSYSGPETGFQPVMDSNNSGAQWKMLSMGPDPNDPTGQRQIRRYENSETGEVVSVPDGASIESALRGASEKERIAAMNNASREAIQRDKSDTRRDLAEAANVLKKYGIDVSAAIKERGLDLAEANGAAKGSARQGYNKDEYAALEKMRDALKYEEDNNGNTIERKLDDAQKARLARIEARMDAMLGIDEGDQNPTTDEDVMFEDGSVGKRHNGKLYRAKGKDASGNTIWEPVQGGASAQQTVGNAQNGEQAPADQTQDELNAQTEEPQQPVAATTPAPSDVDVSEDEDTGMRTVRIENWHYLKPEEQKGWSEIIKESEDSDLDMDAIAKLQKLANTRKDEIESRWDQKAKELRKDWKARGWTRTRIANALKKAEDEWRSSNDPAEIRRREWNNSRSSAMNAAWTASGR